MDKKFKFLTAAGINAKELKKIDNKFYESITKAMDDYSEYQSTMIYDLFSKPAKELKPLEDLWRKENPRDEFVVPDRTEFYKWIRLKILELEDKNVIYGKK